MSPKKRQPGRPLMGKKPASRQYAIRFNDDEFRKIERLAKRAGLKISEWMRAKLLEDEKP